mgnify:CR=1 FL=1
MQLYLAKEGYLENFFRGFHPANKLVSLEMKRELSDAFKNEGSRKLTIRYLNGVLENMVHFNSEEAESDLRDAKKYRRISRDYPKGYYAFVLSLHKIYDFSSKIFGKKTKNLSFATI